MEETAADSESITNGAMQQKVWRSREQQTTTIIEDRLLK